MIKLSKETLSKMKKPELIELIMQLQDKSVPTGGSGVPEERKLSAIEEADRKMAEIRASRINKSTRSYVSSEYKCSNCGQKFEEENVSYVKDINDPFCFSCRRT